NLKQVTGFRYKVPIAHVSHVDSLLSPLAFFILSLLSIPANSSYKRPCYRFIPAGKPSPLHHKSIIFGVIEYIVKNKPSPRVLPAGDLSKSKVIEYQRVAPLLCCIKLLRETDQVLQLFMVGNGSQQGIIAREILETDLFFTDRKSVV